MSRDHNAAWRPGEGVVRNDGEPVEGLHVHGVVAEHRWWGDPDMKGRIDVEVVAVKVAKETPKLYKLVGRHRAHRYASQVERDASNVKTSPADAFDEAIRSAERDVEAARDRLNAAEKLLAAIREARDMGCPATVVAVKGEDR